MRFEFLLAVLLPVGLGAHAASYIVTKSGDTADGVCNSDCSLREAVHAANTNPGLDTVVLRSTTYRLTIQTPQSFEDFEDSEVVDEEHNRSGDLDIRDHVLFKGVQGYTVIDARGIDRALDVMAGVSAEFRDLELRNGFIRERGGAIANLGNTRLVRARLRFNQAASGFNLGQGGAVFNGGTLSIADSQLSDNRALGGEASLGEGGAIFNSGRLNIRTTRFTDNHTSDDNDIGGGGAIMNRGGLVTITRSFFRGNSTSSGGHGGAIANRADGTVRLDNSTVSGNNSGSVGQGGGGAIANGIATGDAGTLTLGFVTVADNRGGGVFSSGELNYADSIIAGNFDAEPFASPNYSAGNNCVSLGGPVAGDRSVVATDGQDCRGQTYVDNAAALQSVLHPLANNGGFAPTHALRGDFDGAIDAGGSTCPAVDQRAARRPVDGDGDGVATCDVGAFERGDDD